MVTYPIEKENEFLADQNQGDSASESGEWREARAQRILDAASSLILRYGYHKTTIDDIAREAGVGKGTLYLHWKTREALFTALIVREKIAMAEDIKQRIAGDPAGATLRNLLKYSALALMLRPLLKAVFLRDREVLGKLVQREQSSDLAEEVLAGFMAYLQVLREQGLVRTDISLQKLAALFSTIFAGFLLSVPLLPDAFRPSDEELAEMMAETGHRTLEPRDPAPSNAFQAASHTLTQYLDHSVAKAQAQFHVDAEPENELRATHPTARARGRKGGRAKKLKTGASVAKVQRMYADKSRSVEEICSELGISRASLYRYIKSAPEEA